MTKSLAWERLREVLNDPGNCDLAVVDSTFKVVSVDLLAVAGGELLVGLPWSLDYPELGAYIHTLSWEWFGIDGLN